jgi:ribonuclease G
MAKNIIVISCDIRETRVALIEDGIIAELHIERKNNPSAGSVGSVVLGKVTRVLPGLQAAFIDVGQERAAFLHVEDLIRPDDFEAYLAGGRKHARGEEGPAGEGEEDAAGEPGGGPAPPLAAAEAQEGTPQDRPSLGEVQAEAEALAAAEDEESDDDLSAEDAAPPPSEVVEATAETARSGDVTLESFAPPADVAPEAGPPSANGSAPLLAEEARDGENAEDQDVDSEWADEHPSEVVERIVEESLASERGSDIVEVAAQVVDAAVESVRAEAEAEAEAEDESDESDLGGDDLPGFTITEPGEPVPRAPVAPRAAGGGPRGRRRRGRGRGRDERGPSAGGGGGGEAREARTADRGRGGARGDRGGRDGGPRGGGARNGSSVPSRISKSTPIREVVREGQEIIVQISKDPIGTKGARCTSHISLPGRYVVYLPTVDHIGVSKRIGSEKERARLRESIEGMKPPSGGLIVRTVAEGLTKKQLKADVGYLVRLWGEVAKKREGARSPTQLWSELDLVLKTARDLFTDEIDQVVIDERGQYDRLCRFVEMFAPERVKDILYYTGEEPIFDAYGIEDEIGRALARKVPLPSGGHLIIDQAEALTAIDVNTGRYVGKGAKDMEETILKTNLEAVHEIAYQLRFRNIGGLIILDLIDMENRKNRETVRRTLEQLLEKDKAKTTLNRISELGLIEMTRKRTRESLGRLLHEPCFYCDGTGQLQSKETIAYEILREIRRKRADLPGYTVQVNAHPAVADLLTGAEKGAVAEAENRYMRKISVVPRKDYHLEQFDLSGK